MPRKSVLRSDGDPAQNLASADHGEESQEEEDAAAVVAVLMRRAIIATTTVKFGKFQRKIKENTTVRKITNNFSSNFL